MKQKTQLELRIEKMVNDENYYNILEKALKFYKIDNELMNNIDFLVDTVMMNPNILYKPISMLSLINFTNETLDFTNGIKKYNLANNKQIILNSVRRNGNNLSLASTKLKNDYNVVLEAIKNNGLAINYASKKLKDNFDLGILAINNNPDSYYYLSENLKNNEDIIKTLIVKEPSKILEFDYLSNYNKLIKKAIKENGMLLKYLSTKNRDNEKIVLLASKNNINSLEYASVRLKNDQNFIINTALKLKSDKVIYFASSSLRHNKQFNINLIEKIGFNLYLMFDEFKDDIDVVEAAVKNDIRNFEHASKRLKENELIVLDLTKKYGPVLRYASSKLLNNSSFMMKAIKLYNGSIKYIGKQLKCDDSFIDEVIKINNWNKEYFKRGNYERKIKKI